MRVKLSAFPAFYFNILCKRHNCKVMARVDTQGSGASVTAMQCEVGGVPSFNSCEGEWEVVISGPGNITITN